MWNRKFIFIDFRISKTSFLIDIKIKNCIGLILEWNFWKCLFILINRSKFFDFDQKLFIFLFKTCSYFLEFRIFLRDLLIFLILFDKRFLKNLVLVIKRRKIFFTFLYFLWLIFVHLNEHFYVFPFMFRDKLSKFGVFMWKIVNDLFEFILFLFLSFDGRFLKLFTDTFARKRTKMRHFNRFILKISQSSVVLACYFSYNLFT